MLVPILALAMQMSPPKTGADLYAACRSVIRWEDNGSQPLTTSDFTQSVACFSFIDGYMEGLKEGDKTICVPPDSSYGTSVRIYVRYMENNPKLRDVPKNVGLHMALQDAYPCPAK